ncbi:MAG: biotin-dependent carboxyltransferase family protein [Desulfarculus sp.]|nr:biotin-dependent carboxyltransferase family protein [Pseudomonadota bacterium]MBV1715568.1 biotin-dependent carboxyltransferase family protein [Desulfarculus sp.]MBU4574166.1 biotin-dependent carboxyltransferase family protein [Pseudomonadota bacterium]MBU4598301.1 biotin-dependent carboxyltransferase family protein [Pseudomonadota bacterium]MBV1739092.1 biotin-dependent carboxyltransferase family protein [Desulfarculus sp.]
MVESVSIPYIKVLRPGALSSLQDLGRLGYQSLGIAEAGAMDRYSLVQANRLLNNPDNSAALEITLVGPKLCFEIAGNFSLTGADLSAQLDGRPLAPGSVYRAESGQVLSFERRINGMRAYLAVPGGFDAPLVLGSRSTYIYAGFGGLTGRALTKGDVLSCMAEPEIDRELTSLPESLLLPPDGPRVLRVIIGPHEERFTEQGIETFLGSFFEVTSESNRMGYRLEGPRIEHTLGPIVVSEATPLGAVQVPGQGQPVLLLRERGTTGGYTKIACIITADIDQVGQAMPGSRISFRRVGLKQAHHAERQRWQSLDSWRPQIEKKDAK